MAKANAAPAATSVPIASVVFREKKTIALAEEYYQAKAQVDLLEGRLKQLKTILEIAMGTAAIAYAGSRVLERTDVPPSPGKPSITIDKSTIGTVIPGTKGRGGYTKLVVR